MESMSMFVIGVLTVMALFIVVLVVMAVRLVGPYRGNISDDSVEIHGVLAVTEDITNKELLRELLSLLADGPWAANWLVRFYGTYEKAYEYIQSQRCEECHGTGTCDDAEPGDMGLNEWTCTECGGTGLKHNPENLAEAFTEV